MDSIKDGAFHYPYLHSEVSSSASEVSGQTGSEKQAGYSTGDKQIDNMTNRQAGANIESEDPPNTATTLGISEVKQHQIDKLASRIESVEYQLEKLSATCDKLRDQISSGKSDNLENEISCLSDEINSMKSSMEVFVDQSDTSLEDIKDISNRTDSLENIMADLSEKILTNKEKLTDSISTQENNAAEVAEIKDRLKLIEDGDEKCEDIMKQFSQVESNYKVMSQMLSSRLQPLEQLRDLLNDRSRGRDENVAKLQELVQEIAAITPRIQHLEIQSRRPVIGFSAKVLTHHSPTLEVIAPYVSVIFDKGGHFNKLHGTFTAPVDGIYCASISASWDENNVGSVQLFVACHKSLFHGEHVCSVDVTPEQNRTYGLGFVQMKAGNTLNVVPKSPMFPRNENTLITFSCFKIN